MNAQGKKTAGNKSSKFRPNLASQETLTYFLKWPSREIFSRKFHGLVLGIDAKGIDVSQPTWLSGCPK